MNKKTATEEIDLIEVFSKIKLWIESNFKKLMKLIILSILFTIRNGLWFILFIIIGIIIGVVNHSTTKLFYKSQMICHSQILKSSEVVNYINNWNFKSSLSKHTQDKLKDIHATFLLDINDDGNWDVIENFGNFENLDTSIMNQRLHSDFCIELEVYDTTIISEVKQEVLKYLSLNKRASTRNNINIRQLQELIPKIKKEISELDSLKKKEYFSDSKPLNAKLNEMFLIEEKEIRLFHNDVINLIKQEQQVEKKLFLSSTPFEVITDFSTPNKEVNNRTSLIKKFIKISLLLGFFIILYFDQRKFILNIIRTNKKLS